jgi:hypothetical protein
MQPDQIKHIELIQAVITRMASNSFLLKGWSVTLSAALIGLAVGKDVNMKFAFLALFPPVLFWGLDAFYMRQERLFRQLYDRIRVMSDADWRANGMFIMSSTADVEIQVPSWLSTIFEPIVAVVHLLVIILVYGILWLVLH